LCTIRSESVTKFSPLAAKIWRSEKIFKIIIFTTLDSQQLIPIYHNFKTNFYLAFIIIRLPIFVVLDGKAHVSHIGEQRYFEDAPQVYEYARERYAPGQIILYGRSLGSGMAAFLAARVQARMLVLEMPFDR
jgi:hypothetical protein